jgi:hypothetical protein
MIRNDHVRFGPEAVGKGPTGTSPTAYRYRRDTCRHTAAPPGRRTDEVPDEPASIGTESTDLIAQQRTLNPLARNSGLKRGFATYGSPRSATRRRGCGATSPRVNGWALNGRRRLPRAALNVAQLHVTEAADLRFHVSPLVTRSPGLP